MQQAGLRRDKGFCVRRTQRLAGVDIMNLEPRVGHDQQLLRQAQGLGGIVRNQQHGFVLAGWNKSIFSFDRDVYLLKLSPEKMIKVSFVRGDCNDDGAVDISDSVFALSSLFLGEGKPSCDDACDSNDDSVIDLSDAIYMLSWSFLGGPAPPPPNKACGPDSTPDDLMCKSFPSCAEAR